MKACYKKIKTAIRPMASSTSCGSLKKDDPLSSSSQLRHVKCHQPRDSLHPCLLRRKRTSSPALGTYPSGSLTVAQIRGVPLNVTTIRGTRMSRSSYIINSEQIRTKKVSTSSLKRSRSLSPHILHTTGVSELKSPTLVRSASNCGTGTLRRRKINGTGLSSIQTYGNYTPKTCIRNYTPIKSPRSNRYSPKQGPKSQLKITDEEEAAISMAQYQLQQKKKSQHHLLHRSEQNGSTKPPSKSRLILQAIVGSGGGTGMDTHTQLKHRGTTGLTQVQLHDPKGRPTTLPMIPRQQVHPQPHQVLPTNPKLLFRRSIQQPFNTQIYSDTSTIPAFKQGPRGFPGQKTGTPSSALFDDDPGIMSEVETSSTGFRRGGKSRSSLPVVRTPSKTLERPLGLVFLQYRSETKRALLPNEITSMDTVKALFVRSFPKQLTLEYLDVMNAKIYIHDNSKDMFYELEDLRDIRGNSVLRLFEPHTNGNGAVPSWDQDQSYFSEPEFDSDFQHQHIHKSKGSNKNPYLPPYAYPIGATLPRGRPYSPLVPAKSVQTGPNSITTSGSTTLPPPKPQRNTVTPTYALVKRSTGQPNNMIYGTTPRPSPGQGDRASSFPPHGHYAPSDAIRPRIPPDIYSNTDPTYISSPERTPRYIPEDPYYYPPPSRSGSITPVVMDEEARFRMEHMERQLENLTGLVQKALIPSAGPTPQRQAQGQPNLVCVSSTQPPRLHATTLPRTVGATNYSLVPTTPRDYIPNREFQDDTDKLSSSSSADERPPNAIDRLFSHPKFGKEKSVSFSDDPPELSKQYSPTLQTVEKPTKSAIKSSTLPRVSQVSERLVPGIHPVVGSLPIPQSRTTFGSYRGREMSPEMYNQLRNLQKKAKELKIDMRALRRNVQAQAHTVRETLRDTFLRFKVVTLAGNDQWMTLGGDPEKVRLKRDEDLYRQEMLKLDKDLTDLETTVEELRSHVINKRTRVNMSDVENMALILSKSSKSVADLKARFPILQESMRIQLGIEMDRMVGEERFLKDEPDHLEISLRRCKKLTGTLVTLKRLASVQEQRLPSTDSSRSLPSPPSSAPIDKIGSLNRSSGSTTSFNPYTPTAQFMVTPNSPGLPSTENQLDELLDELSATSSSLPGQQRNRLNPPDPPKRLPSYPSTESGGSPVRHPPIPPKPIKVPPPPPPRSSSRSSPLISPGLAAIDSDSSESLNSQDGRSGDRLSQRHQELLRKQKLLQDQYMRLQLLQDQNHLKKTGSDGNIGGTSPRFTLATAKNQFNAKDDTTLTPPNGGVGGGGSLRNLAMANETDIL